MDTQKSRDPHDPLNLFGPGPLKFPPERQSSQPALVVLCLLVVGGLALIVAQSNQRRVVPENPVRSAPVSAPEPPPAAVPVSAPPPLQEVRVEHVVNAPASPPPPSVPEDCDSPEWVSVQCEVEKMIKSRLEEARQQQQSQMVPVGVSAQPLNPAAAQAVLEQRLRALGVNAAKPKPAPPLVPGEGFDVVPWDGQGGQP